MARHTKGSGGVLWLTTLLLAWIAVSDSIHAQGSLTPPAGPIAPVMRSLDQMEPRLPLQSGVTGVVVRAGGEIVISNSGSYYLTGNLTTTNPSFHCIEIPASAMNVTLDLNGFTVSRTNGTGATYGIYIQAVAGQQVVIRDGFLVGGGTNAGFAAAVFTGGGGTGNVQVDNVHVRQVRSGIELHFTQARNAVRNSSVEGSGNVGITADVVTGCVVRDTRDAGIAAETVSDCRVRQTFGSGYGIFAQTVMNSSGISQGGVGISCTTAINSRAETSGPAATAALLASLATSCFATHSGGLAIQAFIGNGCTGSAGTNVLTFKYNMP